MVMRSWLQSRASSLIDRPEFSRQDGCFSRKFISDVDV